MRLGFDFENHVKINNKIYFIDVSFKRIMRVIALLRDDEISQKVRVNTALRLLLKPASRLRLCFVNYVKKAALLNEVFSLIGTKGEAKKAGILSLEKDGDLIYSAFLQAYGIDLEKDEIDWRAFRALLSCVPEGTALFSVIRAREAGEIPAFSEGFGEGLNRLFKQLIGGKE